MSATNRDEPRVKTPVLTVTRYDFVSSLMIAVVFGLVLAVVWMVVVWLTNRLPEAPALVPVEFLSGGDPLGAANETLRLESDEELSEDPAIDPAEVEEQEVEEVIENVIELAELATQQVQEVLQPGLSNEGEAGRAEGTGRRPLGEGPGDGGFSREQRWYVRFTDRGTLDEYARQLDFFNIELGVLLPGSKLIYISKLANKKPSSKSVTTGDGEDRLYMTWKGGGRRKADTRLFQKAGVSVGNGIIFHFYPPATEQMLARLEIDYRKRKVRDIRRTYFVVQADDDDGYKFVVRRQTYLR